MKYPESQFIQLKHGIEELAKAGIAVKEINPSALHFLVYQQHESGQAHNWLYISESGELKRRHKITDNIENYKKVLTLYPNFEIYPSGCNDNHIETAVKAAIKQLFN